MPEPVNPLLPCGHGKLDGCSGCSPSPHPPEVASALLEAGLANDADLGLAVRLLVQRLGLNEVMVRNIWDEVMGPGKPFPERGDPGVFGPPERSALKWIWGKCMRVDWLWRQCSSKPPPADLPEGVVLDDG